MHHLTSGGEVGVGEWRMTSSVKSVLTGNDTAYKTYKTSNRIPPTLI